MFIRSRNIVYICSRGENISGRKRKRERERKESSKPIKNQYIDEIILFLRLTFCFALRQSSFVIRTLETIIVHIYIDIYIYIYLIALGNSGWKLEIFFIYF